MEIDNLAVIVAKHQLVKSIQFQLLVMRSQRNFTHASTVQLPKHVQKLIVIGLTGHKIYINVFWLKLTQSVDSS